MTSLLKREREREREGGGREREGREKVMRESSTTSCDIFLYNAQDNFAENRQTRKTPKKATKD